MLPIARGCKALIVGGNKSLLGRVVTVGEFIGDISLGNGYETRLGDIWEIDLPCRFVPVFNDTGKDTDCAKIHHAYREKWMIRIDGEEHPEHKRQFSENLERTK